MSEWLQSYLEWIIFFSESSQGFSNLCGSYSFMCNGWDVMLIFHLLFNIYLCQISRCEFRQRFSYKFFLFCWLEKRTRCWKYSIHNNNCIDIFIHIDVLYSFISSIYVYFDGIQIILSMISFFIFINAILQIFEGLLLEKLSILFKILISSDILFWKMINFESYEFDLLPKKIFDFDRSAQPSTVAFFWFVFRGLVLYFHLVHLVKCTVNSKCKFFGLKKFYLYILFPRSERIRHIFNRFRGPRKVVLFYLIAFSLTKLGI